MGQARQAPAPAQPPTFTRNFRFIRSNSSFMRDSNIARSLSSSPVPVRRLDEPRLAERLALLHGCEDRVKASSSEPNRSARRWLSLCRRNSRRPQQRCRSCCRAGPQAQLADVRSLLASCSPRKNRRSRGAQRRSRRSPRPRNDHNAVHAAARRPPPRRGRLRARLELGGHRRRGAEGARLGAARRRSGARDQCEVVRGALAGARRRRRGGGGGARGEAAGERLARCARSRRAAREGGGAKPEKVGGRKGARARRRSTRRSRTARPTTPTTRRRRRSARTRRRSRRRCSRCTRRSPSTSTRRRSSGR